MWSEERTALLRKLWAEGLSASQCAAQLGGVTRNACIGKIHRIGMKGRSEPNRRLHSMKRARRVPTQPGELQPICPTLTIQGLTNFTCRYPIGDPQDSDFGFCGRGCNNVENPYCVSHARLCYVPVKKRTHDATARLANWLDKRSWKVAA